MMQGSPNQRFWMWCRIGGQGATVAAMLGGAIYAGHVAKKKSEQEGISDKDAVTTHST